MNEPVRLREEAESPVELLLLEAGASYRSSPDARAKTLAALGLAGSVAVSAGAVSLAAPSLLGKLGWAKVLLISSLGAGVVVPVGYGIWNRFHGPETAPVPASAPVALVAPAPPKMIAPPDGPAPLAVSELAVEPSKPEAAKVSSQGALAAELSALDAVRGKLADGDANGALAQLDDYSRSFPRGRLVLEAEVLRIDALAKSGHRGSAKKRAETFLRRHPNSVLASRVRAYLD